MRGQAPRAGSLQAQAQVRCATRSIRGTSHLKGACAPARPRGRASRGASWLPAEETPPGVGLTASPSAPTPDPRLQVRGGPCPLGASGKSPDPGASGCPPVGRHCRVCEPGVMESVTPDAQGRGCTGAGLTFLSRAHGEPGLRGLPLFVVPDQDAEVQGGCSPEVPPAELVASRVRGGASTAGRLVSQMNVPGAARWGCPAPSAVGPPP